MRFHTFIAFVLGSIAAVHANPSGQSRPQDAISLGMPASLTLHEPIVAVLAIENTRNEPLQVDLGGDRTDNLRVTLRQGSAAPAPSLRLATGGIRSGGEFSIAPGERYQQRLVLDDWFVFDRPGAYEVDIRLSWPDGDVDMDVNIALEDYEVARGFILASQSYPVTDKIVVDFDK